MVAKIASGKSINGALNYNENKVADGKAALLYVTNYPKNGEDLSFNEKLLRLTNQADLNEKVQHKCVHISLNFDPTEKLSFEQYQEIADTYMEKIGFANQPYLVYEHTDAAHSHLHIVTTSIRSDGSSIRLHNIGRNVSEPARKEIEKHFNLIPAESRSQQEMFVLKPVDLNKAVYGKLPTKQAISNIVRSVVKHYKFGSLPEFNAILNQFNIVADSGDEGTLMREKGGLVYSMVNQKMEKIGVPIKASSIYDKPILKELRKKFEINQEKRIPYKERVCKIIQDTLKQGVSKIEFKNLLASNGINAVFRYGENGNLYGVTYIDNKTYSVFNGSDLGKGYAAKGVSERFLPDKNNIELQNNKSSVEVILKETDFTKGIHNVMSDWIKKGFLIDAKSTEDGSIRYSMGNKSSNRESFYPLDYKMSAYLNVNNYIPFRAEFLRENLSQTHQDNSEIKIKSIIDECFSLETPSKYLSKELLEEAKKKKRRRRY